ncbi:MAG: hypothetical protein WC875_02095 [Candidatus Absconditabacterales bacterium]
MIKFVIPRPVKKIHRSRMTIDTEKKISRKVLSRRRVPLKTIWIIFIVFVLIYGGFLLLKNTLFAKQYTIDTINYDSGDIQIYDDPYLYKAVTAQIKQENYNVVRFNKNTILATLQGSFPFLKDMTITFINANTVKVDLIFQEPQLIIRNADQKYGVFRGHIFPIYSGNTMGAGVRILDLPDYLSGMNAMIGFFYRQSAEDIIQQTDLIYEAFSGQIQHIEYLPGGERTIVYLKDKKIYINNLADVAQQIRSYQLLKKYYSDYASLKEIDLGSLEMDKVIVKK